MQSNVQWSETTKNTISDFMVVEMFIADKPRKEFSILYMLFLDKASKNPQQRMNPEENESPCH
jgi:hypothetical protein